ncbi:lipopolysaccharide biosynthesis protein RfbH [Thermodesulfovibrionales bacterium]|nr:lipopolysaccharide biosynthesis protein RfbH [Thermodesulfovibrionales bacterium]
MHLKANKEIKDVLKANIFKLVKEYYDSVHKPYLTREFIPNEDKINYAGRVYDEKEMINLVDSALDFWLTADRFAKQFEEKFAKFLGIKHCILTNSGSSANLLAISALTSQKLGQRRLKPGDEVITTACGFPTTVNPIIQNNLVPVFLDVDMGTYNIQVNKIEKAITKKTKAIFIAHTLGNPAELDKIMKIVKKYDLFLIEDNCDSLGSKYKEKYTGTFGHISTCSFYPPHMITMGEGGAVLTNGPLLKQIILSFRDWGRDCWCAPGKDNTCGKRFSWQLGELPYGFDHKYIYSHFGYNLRVTDMQAAIGVAQLEKLPSFIEARKRNWKMLREGLDDLSDMFILPSPSQNSNPNWFGFILTVRENAGFLRDEIVKYLEDNKIQTRMLFAGNLIRHPCFDEMRKSRKGYRVIGDLHNTDKVTRDTFWVGVYPGMKKEMIKYMIEKIHEFVKSR